MICERIRRIRRRVIDVVDDIRVGKVEEEERVLGLVRLLQFNQSSRPRVFYEFDARNRGIAVKSLGRPCGDDGVVWVG